MKKNSSFLKDFVNYFSSNLIIKIMALFTLPIIANLLSPSDYGYYSYVMVYVSYANILFTFNLLPAISRFYYDEIDHKSFMGTSIIGAGSIFLSFIILFIVFQNILIDYFHISYEVFVFVFIFVFITSISSIFHQLFVALRKSKLISLLSVLNAMLLFVLTLLYIYFGDKKYSLIYANLSVGLVFSLIYIYYIKEYIAFKYNKSYLIQNVKYSVPLAFDAISAILIVNIDKIMLEKSFGLEVLGLYSFAYNVGLLLTSVVIYPLLSAWTPEYFEDMKSENYTKLDKNILFMWESIVGVSIVMVLFYREFVVLLFNKSYYDGFVILPYIVMSGLFLFLWQIYGRSIGYAKRNIYMIFVTLAAGLLNILLNYILIPKYQMLGASIATVISYVLMFLLGIFISKYIIKMYLFDYKKLVSAFLLFVCSFIFSLNYSNYTIELDVVILKVLMASLLLSILFYKKIMKRVNV